MLRRFSTDFTLFSLSLDALLIATALYVATAVRTDLSHWLPVKLIPPPLSVPPLLYLVFPAMWVLVLLFSSVYDGRRNLRFWKELSNLSATSLLAAVVLAGVLYLSYREISRALFLSFASLAYLFLLSWRLLYRLGYRLGILRGVQLRRVLIAGSGELGKKIGNQIRLYEGLDLRLVGFVDEGIPAHGVNIPLLGDLSQFAELAQQYQVDDVVIALPGSAYEETLRLAASLASLPVKVWLIPDTLNLALYRTGVKEMAGIPMLDLRAPALSDSQRLAKRAFDLSVTLICLPVALILMAMVALALKLTQPGTVLFRQKRVGENGQLFTVYKFRTMNPNSEACETPPHPKAPNDPRLTRLGKWLRRSSLDELPQIFNILKGEMSLVGPRPELPGVVEGYQPWQRKRFSLPPGLTGWWQIRGRADRPMALHTQDDLYYVENYSVFLDIWILIQTVGAVLSGRGAY